MLHLPVLIYLVVIIGFLVLLGVDKFFPSKERSSFTLDFKRLVAKLSSLKFINSSQLLTFLSILVTALGLFGILSYFAVSSLVNQGFNLSNQFAVFFLLMLLAVFFLLFVFVKVGIIKFAQEEEEILDDDF